MAGMEKWPSAVAVIAIVGVMRAVTIGIMIALSPVSVTTGILSPAGDGVAVPGTIMARMQEPPSTVAVIAVIRMVAVMTVLIVSVIALLP